MNEAGGFSFTLKETLVALIAQSPLAGRRYFGLLETDKVHFIESDGRVYLNRNKDLYNLVLLDAYRELGLPFHLLTREFYELVKARLAPGGAVASCARTPTR
jgi:spermidine synthase